MNKAFFSFIFLTFTNFAIGAPCGGVPGANHQNPDGSSGGFVAKTATVSKTSYVDASSSVCERARVEGNAKLRNGTEVGGQANIFGNATLNSSRVKGLAKVYGNAVVTNSSVCQMSDINFNVIGSDYYCATDDEEPKDPGELGNKTVIGIDSDVDGVRDDVEIWINNNTTNTPNKDMYNERMALKQIAKNMQSAIKYKDNKLEARKYMLEYLDAKRCLDFFVKGKTVEVLKEHMDVIMINTEQRFFAWTRIQASLDGLSLNSSKKEVCNFEKR